VAAFLHLAYTGRCRESALIISARGKPLDQESRKVRDEWVGALCDEKEQSARDLYAASGKMVSV
jgi:hypothetical protein